MPNIMPRILAAVVALLTGLSAEVAGVAEVNVLCSGAMRGVLQQLAPDFEKSSGHHLVIEYATAGKVEEKVAADEAIDVAILSKPRAEKLVRSAKLVGGTATVLARVPIGLAVKKGVPHPDISSIEAFKRTLLNAKSIAYVDPASGGTSGIFVAQAFEKLGIATEIKSKVRLVSPAAGQSSPRVGEAVERGEAEIGIQPVSELMELAGIDVVGPLPAGLQSPDLVYLAGSPALAGQPLAAKALIEFLAAPSARTGLQGKRDGAGYPADYQRVKRGGCETRVCRNDKTDRGRSSFTCWRLIRLLPA
jgi:molybdate transport system substrate-binding protein